MSAFEKIFGTHSERELKRIKPIVDKVESYHEAMGKLSDDELKDKTKEFKKRLANAWKKHIGHRTDYLPIVRHIPRFHRQFYRYSAL